MSKYQRHKRKDSNHKEIVNTFRSAGAVVDDVSDLPDLGYDIIVSYSGSVVFTEIKDGEKPPSKRKLTESEESAQARHGEKFAVVKTVQEALGLLTSMKEHSIIVIP